jgi:anti-anti-sigma factor
VDAALFGCVGHRRNGGVAWLELSGEIDLSTRPQLELILRETLPCARLVVLDMRRLEFLDLTGAEAIMEASVRALLAGGRLILVSVPAQVASVFSRSGLAEAVEITPHVRLAA